MPFRLTIWVLICCFFITTLSNAQVPQLPAMNITTDQAKNILAWVNQYDGVKLIAIQRSLDSVKNFVTIGSFNAPKKGEMSFVDERPMPGKNHYRILVLFAGDVEWYSNTYKVTMDSSLIANSVLHRIESGITNSKSGTGNSNNPSATSSVFYYTPSTHVYTNPYTGHINISLDDALSQKYNIKFYTPESKEILRISRITKPMLVLDKNNFNAKGTYQFKLFDGNDLVESGYVTIY